MLLEIPGLDGVCTVWALMHFVPVNLLTMREQL
jgi:hypothetical protein